MLFANCQVLEYCGENCKTELKLCYGSCGKNIEGKMTDNVIDFYLMSNWNLLVMQVVQLIPIALITLTMTKTGNLFPTYAYF